MLVSDAIAYALRIAGVLGVGQVALPQDTGDAQAALALMLKQWQRKRWIVYRLDDVAIAATPGKGSYTIGPDGDIMTDRPGSIESAFLRQLVGSGPNAYPVDYPLHRIGSKEEWNAISLKFLGSWPGSWFYDPTMPNGTVYIWPIPIQNFFELHFSVPLAIGDFTPDTELETIQPPEAEEAIAYNLAARLRVMYALPPDPGMLALARASLNTLRTTNFAMRPLVMPAALRRPSRMRNPMGGFVPETSATVPFPVLR